MRWAYSIDQCLRIQMMPDTVKLLGVPIHPNLKIALLVPSLHIDTNLLMHSVLVHQVPHSHSMDVVSSLDSLHNLDREDLVLKLSQLMEYCSLICHYDRGHYWSNGGNVKKTGCEEKLRSILT